MEKEPRQEATPVAPPQPVELSPEEKRARRWLIIGGSIIGVLLIGLIAGLVFLSIDAYQATVTGEGPTPGSVVVGLFRDAAIIFVAFETLIIGLLLIILMLQIQSLVNLLRDEIKPMMEAINDTVSTVRGTTEFMSDHVVSPVMKWSGYLSGLRRVVREISGLRESTRDSSIEEDEEQRPYTSSKEVENEQ